MIRTLDNAVDDYYFLGAHPDFGSMKDYAVLSEDSNGKNVVQSQSMSHHKRI